MKRLIKHLLPNSVHRYLKQKKEILSFMLSGYRDMHRFYRYASCFHPEPSKTCLASIIAIDYHRLEKGLSLHNPRPGFGVTACNHLLCNLQQYIDLHDVSSICIHAINALHDYFVFNNQFATEQNELYQRYSALRGQIDQQTNVAIPSAPATQERNYKADALSDAPAYNAFVTSRHSMRTFSPETVDNSLIESAISTARHAPSVCNRQPWHVHAIKEKETISSILALQGGARGFENEPTVLLIITVDIRAFHYPGERNEYWIDGGIFTLSTLNSLHSVGLAACCLNWCVNRHRDNALRQIVKIADHEAIIALIVAGHYPQHYRVTSSPRKDVEEILHVHPTQINQ